MLKMLRRRHSEVSTQAILLFNLHYWADSIVLSGTFLTGIVLKQPLRRPWVVRILMLKFPMTMVFQITRRSSTTRRPTTTHGETLHLTKYGVDRCSHLSLSHGRRRSRSLHHPHHLHHSNSLGSRYGLVLINFASISPLSFCLCFGLFCGSFSVKCGRPLIWLSKCVGSSVVGSPVLRRYHGMCSADEAALAKHHAQY